MRLVRIGGQGSCHGATGDTDDAFGCRDSTARRAACRLRFLNILVCSSGFVQQSSRTEWVFFVGFDFFFFYNKNILRVQ